MPVVRGGCPFDHAALSQQKTAQAPDINGTPIERDTAGVWQVRGFKQARAILRSSDTRQAGFKAELLARMPQRMNPPILYQEGKPHNDQRKQTARFFTPKTVSEKYRQLMETLADRLIRALQRTGRADLSNVSMKLAVRVAGEVVGLTNSRVPGMDRRLNAFFSNDATAFSWTPQAIVSAVRNQARVAAFFYLDVKPAIEARKRQRREDVISHLLDLGYTDMEILTECITYAAAGMATTREFISVAAWHMLEQPDLRARYLHSAEDERHAMLHEILRLEPVVGHLYRRATADIMIDAEDAPVTIRQGELINLHIYATNADEAIVGELPRAVCPGRALRDERTHGAVLSFGDGAHRCPGAYIAIHESDIFLQKLLVLPGLKIEQKPSVSWNELIASYELRNFLIAVD